MNAEHPSLPTVLVAEDETLLLKSLEIKLRKEGFRVLLCSDGDAALAALAMHRPDIIITDLNLPGAHGCELAKAAKESAHPAYVIVASGTDDDCEKQKVLDCGADEFICKPYNLTRLVEKLKVVSCVAA